MKVKHIITPIAASAYTSLGWSCALWGRFDSLLILLWALFLIPLVVLLMFTIHSICEHWNSEI